VIEDKGIIMNDVEETKRHSAEIQSMKFEDLLSKYPPGEVHAIANLGVIRSPTSLPILIKPRLKLYCANSYCNGIRFFDSYQTKKVTLTEKWSRIFVHYSCANCRSHTKIFAVMVRWNPDLDEGEAVKLGEWPPFGPKVSSRVISILGKNKELFLMGRRAEMQGLGLGALAYYRKVIENQKDNDALNLATAARLILTALAERIVKALEDQTDLDEAVNYILQHD